MPAFDEKNGLKILQLCEWIMEQEKSIAELIKETKTMTTDIRTQANYLVTLGEERQSVEYQTTTDHVNYSSQLKTYHR